MKDLLSRVGEDVSQLKSDVASLLSHTGRHTLPSGARDIRDSAKDHLQAGSKYAASQFRHLRSQPAKSSAGILGGLILLSAVGAGIYYLCKCENESCSEEDTENEES